MSEARSEALAVKGKEGSLRHVDVSCVIVDEAQPAGAIYTALFRIRPSAPVLQRTVT